MSTDRVNQHPGNNLDLLRLLFASLVLLSHAPELIDGNRTRELLSTWTGGAESFGEFAVSGFFALSGYLIMASWCRRPDPAVYFRNRILRIYPAFIVAFCLSVLVVGPWASPNIAAYFHQFGIRRYLFSMFTLREPWFAQSFKGMHYGDVNGAMWTISYEFACYIAVALVGWCARHYLKWVWLVLTAAFLGAACFPQELKALPSIGFWPVSDAVRMWSAFFAGGGMYLLDFKGIKSVKTLLIVTLLFVVTLFSHRFQFVGFAIFGSLFFLSIGLARSRLAFTRNWPDISYGTYLYGWPVLQLVIWSLPGLGPWSVFAMSLAISLACGYLSWQGIEAPFMRLKSSRPR